MRQYMRRPARSSRTNWLSRSARPPWASRSNGCARFGRTSRCERKTGATGTARPAWTRRTTRPIGTSRLPSEISIEACFIVRLYSYLRVQKDLLDLREKKRREYRSDRSDILIIYLMLAIRDHQEKLALQDLKDPKEIQDKKCLENCVYSFRNSYHLYRVTRE